MESKSLVRQAVKNDLKYVVEMIKELAEFEGIKEEQKLTEQDLKQYGNFENDSEKLFHCFVAESDNAGTPIGYSISYFTFSTCIGKTYYLEDIYVKPDYRKTGVGKSLFMENLKFAVNSKCQQFDLRVMKENSSKSFYMKLGFENLTVKEGWEMLRLNKDGMRGFFN